MATEEKVVLSAADQFSAVFKQAQRSVDGMKQSLDAVRSSLGAIGVTVGAGALINIHYDALKAVAALDDMAEATGSSVEQLSAMQRVARVGGQDFEGFTSQIGRMVKGLKQGGEEGSKAAAAFDYLGIKTKDANGVFRDTGQIVVELAKKLDQYGDGGNKLAIVQDALGKGAERYLPFLKDIAEQTDLAAKVTAKQAAEAETAEKNIRRLTLAMEDGRRELVVSYTPAIIEFTDKLLAANRAAGSLPKAIALMATSDTGNISGRLREIDAQLAKHQAAADANNSSWLPTRRLGAVASEHTMTRLIEERDYLRSIQRQQALGTNPEGNYDAIDRQMHKKRVLDYQSPEKEGKKLSPYDNAVLEAQKAISKAQYGDSDFLATQLDIEAGKYGKINDAQKTRILQLAAERDLQREDADLKREIGKIIEANGEKELRATEERRKILDEYRSLAMSQEEMENLTYQRRLDQLKGFTDQELEAVGGRQAIEQQMEGEHMERLRQIRSQGLNNLAAFNKASWQQQTSTVVGELSSLTAGVAQHNRKLFEINKIAATANAIISTAAGVTKALEVYPPPLSFLMAAAQAAVGAVQIATIQSTQFGSGTAPSVGGTPAPAVTPVSATGASSTQQSPQTTIIHFHGSQSEAEVIRRFVEALNENSRDGGRIFVS